MFPLTADSELPDNNVSRLGRVAKQPMSHWIESGARLTRESLSKLVSLAELSIFRDMRERIIKCFYIYYLLLYVIYYLKERIIKCTSSNLLINWNNIVIWLVGIILFLIIFWKHFGCPSCFHLFFVFFSFSLLVLNLMAKALPLFGWRTQPKDLFIFWLCIKLI